MYVIYSESTVEKWHPSKSYFYPLNGNMGCILEALSNEASFFSLNLYQFLMKERQRRWILEALGAMVGGLSVFPLRNGWQHIKVFQRLDVFLVASLYIETSKFAYCALPLDKSVVSMFPSFSIKCFLNFYLI